MSLFIFVVGLVIGVLLGRLYGWMKYHYPEFQEAIKVRVAEKQLERVRLEAEIEAYRGNIDDMLDSRMNR